MDAEQNSTEDRGCDELTPRQAARDSVFVGATIWFDTGQNGHAVRIRNISAGGMMIDSPEDRPVGSSVQAEIKGIGQIAGSVVWSTAKHLGVRFATIVDPEAARIRPEPMTYPGIKLPEIRAGRPGLAVR